MLKNRLKKIIISVVLLSVVFCLWAGRKVVSPPVEPAVADPVVKKLTFVGVGDNLIHDPIYIQANRYAGGSGNGITGTTETLAYDFKPMYKAVANIIKNADVAYINQETIPGGDHLGISAYPCFNSPQQLIYDMKDLGFDIFSAATNHSYDKGVRGVENAYALYESLNEDITAPGIYKKGERNFRLHEKNGIRLGLLSYTDLTNGLSLPDSSQYYVPRMDDEDQLFSDVEYAKENSDFVIVFVHWGNENQFEPSKRQRDLANIFADAGADIIIGTHPHVIQPVEYIGNVPVIYSLGNFISAQLDKANMVEGMISFDIIVFGDEKRIENLTFTPLINYFSDRFSNTAVYTLADYKINGKDGTHKLGVTAEYAQKLVSQVIDPQFLK